MILCTYLFYAAHRSEGAVAKIGHAGRYRSPHAIDPQSEPRPSRVARIIWLGRNDGLAKQDCGCARGIGAVKAQLRFSDCADAHRPVPYRSAFERVAETGRAGKTGACGHSNHAVEPSASKNNERFRKRRREELNRQRGCAANRSVFRRSIYGTQPRMQFARRNRGRPRSKPPNLLDCAACLWPAQADIDAASCAGRARCFP